MGSSSILINSPVSDGSGRPEWGPVLLVCTTGNDLQTTGRPSRRSPDTSVLNQNKMHLSQQSLTVTN